MEEGTEKQPEQDSGIMDIDTEEIDKEERRNFRKQIQPAKKKINILQRSKRLQTQV